MRPPLRRRWLSQALGIAFLASGLWALPVQAQTTAAAGTLVVSAAASLTNAFAEIGQAFEKAHPGSHITFNFAASGPLLAQIQQGAPVDVFASADQETMDRADKGGLLAAGSRQNFAGNELVLIVPTASRLAPPTQLRDLTQPGWQRIAIGNPATVPVGRYTRQ
ncbi:MAG: molybdate ABC transporter substrate-binding protein, partial [Curvibacter sp.]|nr:molybdate ABC transporter substrate-binding protein [Curvibacter sp.]